MPIMMIFAVVVIALIVTAGLYEGMQISGAGNISNVATQIGALARNVQDLYSMVPDYSSLTPAAVCQANAFPPQMGGCGPNNAAAAVYGSVDVVPAASIGSSLGNAGFAVRLGAQTSHLNTASCIQLLTTVSAWGVSGTPGTLTTNNGVVSPTSAESWCRSIAGGQIDFIFAKNQ